MRPKKDPSAAKRFSREALAPGLVSGVRLKVPDLGGGGLIVIVRTVEVGYRRIDELIDVNALKTIDSNGIELAAELVILSPPEGADPAVSAKHMVDTVGLIIDEVGLSRQEPKGVRCGDGAPQSRHRAHRAIALEGARAQIEIHLEANSAAVAAPSVCFLHD